MISEGEDYLTAEYSNTWVPADITIFKVYAELDWKVLHFRLYLLVIYTLVVTSLHLVVARQSFVRMD